MVTAQVRSILWNTGRRCNADTGFFQPGPVQCKTGAYPRRLSKSRLCSPRKSALLHRLEQRLATGAARLLRHVDHRTMQAEAAAPMRSGMPAAGNGRPHRPAQLARLWCQLSATA